MTFQVTNETDKMAVRDYLDRLKVGKSYEVSITLKKDKRTIPQNKLYRLWLTCISKETGNDVDTLHRFFGGKFLGFEESDVFGKKVHQPISTRLLTKEQFTKFLDEVSAFSAEQGIILPDPSDLCFNQFMNEYD